MGLKKNVASQKIGFVMVDKTDFATPETGITVAGVIRKDGGASAAIANTVTELTNGFYVLTLTNSETNANLLQLRFHDSGASCATQFLTFLTDDDSLSDIHSAIDECLSHLDNGTYGLDALETLLSDISSAIDSAIHSTLDAIHSTVDGPITNYLTSIVDDSSKIHSTLDETTFGLDAIETIVSDILSTLDDNVDSKLTSILADTGTTLDNKIDSILVDTGTTLDDRQQSILADTQSLIVDVSDIHSATDETLSHLDNGTYGLDALETLLSDIQSHLDSGIHSTLDAIHSTVDTLGGDSNDIDSILSKVTSILTDTGTTLDNKLDFVLADTGTTLDNKIDSILSTLDGPILSTLDRNQTDLDAIKTKTDNQPAGIQKNVQLGSLPFLMVDDTDFATPETGKTVTAQVSKDGGSFAACTNSVSEVSNGVYVITLTNSEMNADTVTLKCTATGCAQRTIVMKTST